MEVIEPDVGGHQTIQNIAEFEAQHIRRKIRQAVDAGKEVVCQLCTCDLPVS